MIYVADSAKKQIAEIRRREGYGDDYFVRVWVTSGGCSGLTYQLEFSGGLEGKGFHFNNPNASRTCACGESFSV